MLGRHLHRFPVRIPAALFRALSSSSSVGTAPLSGPKSTATALYFWGSNTHSQLPTLEGSTFTSPRRVNVSEVIASLDYEADGDPKPDDVTLKHFRVGKGANTALTFTRRGKDEDRTYVYGDGKYMKAGRVEGLPDAGVEDVILGPSNLAVVVGVEDRQRVYMCGLGGSVLHGFGQLGLGPNVADEGKDYVAVPEVVESLVEDETPLQGLALAANHSVALTAPLDGGEATEVLTAGSGQYGKLGNVDAVDQLYFEPVETLSLLPEPCVQVREDR